MSSKFAANFGETNYPGKAEELKAERNEKHENEQRVESPFDYNSIRAAEGRGPQHSDNAYNNVEEEYKPASTENKFISSNDIIGETEDDILNKVQESMAREKASLVINDPYGYAELIEKLFDSAQAKGDKKEIDKIIDRASIFIKQYHELLFEYSVEEEDDEEDKKAERDAVSELFKKVMGDIAYIKDGETERVERLANFKSPRDAELGADKGKKIYYGEGDRTNRGFLSQREANEYMAEKNIKNNNKKSIFSNIGSKLKVFNTITKKVENLEK